MRKFFQFVGELLVGFLFVGVCVGIAGVIAVFLFGFFGGANSVIILICGIFLVGFGPVARDIGGNIIDSLRSWATRRK